MLVLKTLIICAAWLTVHCQGHNGPTTTPVPILKQINRQNDDGSYSYGYEAADGSFKIETKYPNGDVAGKYGYVDENGKPREISYGASSQRGFEPEGPGIMVPPPTLNNNQHSTNALTDGQEDDGQYREDPSIYEDPKYNSRAQPRPAPIRQYHQPAQPAPARQYQPEPAAFPTAAPAPQYQQPSQFRSAPLYSQQTSLFNQGPQQFPSQNQDFRPQSQVYHQQPQFSYQAYTPQPYNNFQSQSFQPQPQPQYQQQGYNQNQNYNPFFGHPAQNFDPSSGSYSINFTG
ncbi:activating signal cointegrator 1 complex subunit 2 homolog [Helicoverpa zea]|uniref:activating signal cointegrator 1 complex subunit 2 homolog n=1 Tax=Helicoverpa zea TaxID=7113 RepID=UPI001F59B120|nr:activating signal cointegrator 1 complex subunit 2 homolog [Helicoverpa zea]